MFVTGTNKNPHSQQTGSQYETPALVVGIIVDQMRPDYVYRYWDKLGDDGFKRLVNEGFTFRNTYFDHFPASTAPGFAAVYTGATPAIHGILANDWYSRELGRSINSIEMAGYQSEGSGRSYSDSKGPHNMLTSTVGDELRLHTNMESKVIAVSLKDRGAILPGGHLGKAYWYESETGNFITSPYYQNELPDWVANFNSRNLAQEYLGRPWDTLLPIGEYTESIEDDNPYERVYPDQQAPVFPHDLPARVNDFDYNAGLLSATPFGDKLLTEFAIAAIENEGLGQGDVPDMLSIGYSASDGIGHSYGPGSVEIQDYYLRLDRYIAKLLTFLDTEIGIENVVVFLTSDHGGVHVPGYLSDLGMPAGYFDADAAMEKLREYLLETYGADLFLSFSNRHIWLDHELMDQHNLDHGDVQRDVARFMLTFEGVGGAVTARSLTEREFTKEPRASIQQAHHQKRGGDVVIWKSPQYIFERSFGTSHGTPWAYDRHAPMHWFGWNIPAGQTLERVYISGIAPTIAAFLNSPYPSGNIGNPMNEYMKP